MNTFKPTLSKPTPQGANFEKNFKKTMNANNVVLNETDGLLSEAEQSLKKKIFSLAKMEALVFSDPKLKAKYEEMAENGEEKYGYHYNETIQNMLFNDYVLNSPLYLQKYKQAIPQVEKKRRDKSGINQLKKTGEKKMQHKLDIQKPKPAAGIDLQKPEENEETGSASSGAFAPALGMQKKEIAEMTGTGGGSGAIGGAGASGNGETGTGAYYTPTAWGKGDLMKAKGKAKVKTIPMIKGGTIIAESNYLTETDGFEKFIQMLNEEDDADMRQMGQVYQQTHTGSNKGLGVSELPQSPERTQKIKDIEDNTMLFLGQDIQHSPDADVEIFHQDMTEPHTLIPHQDNKIPEMQADGIASKLPKTPVGTWDKINMKGRKAANDEMVNKTSAFTSDTIKNWDDADAKTEMDTLKTGDPDKVNLQAMEESKQIKEVAKSKEQQRLFGMAHAVQKGELSPSKVGGAVKKIAKDVSPEDVEDFASTKHKGLPEKVKSVDEDAMTMANASKMQPKEDSMSNKMDSTMPVGMQDIQESMALLEELNNELNAYSVHQSKLMKMSEDKKPSSLIMKDRLGDENKANFKKDFNNSDTKETIDVEKELQWKDQQTDVPENPQDLAQDIEDTEVKTADMKSGEGLKDVGDSANDKGDEIPKRNFTTKEQEEVNMYRNGQHSLVYDNDPGKRFEDRMKADMGDKVYEMRKKQLEFKGKAPMYNKVAQPVQDTKAERSEFDKEKSGWNEREGLKESMVTGRYINALNKRRLIDFKLNEVLIADKVNENLFEIDFTGLGNTYDSKTINNKVIVNEAVVNVIAENKFYTDGQKIFAVKNPVQSLNENDQKAKPVINEQFEKMKHLSGYKPNNFINTKNIKL